MNSTTLTLKGVSIWNPWAWLMAERLKRNETRNWKPPYRGPMCLHASEKVLEGSVSTYIQNILDDRGLDIQTLPRGQITAIGILVHCERITRSTQPDVPELLYGDYTPGRYVWVFENVWKLNAPIEFEGRQSVFDVPEKVWTNEIRKYMDRYQSGWWKRRVDMGRQRGMGAVGICYEDRDRGASLKEAPARKPSRIFNI